jgi:hypothetical protein
MSPELVLDFTYDFESFCFSFYWLEMVSFQISNCGWGFGHQDLILTNEQLLEIIKRLEKQN